MKKLFAVIALLSIVTVLTAQERVLFDASKLSEATYTSETVSVDNAADKWYLDFGGLGVTGSAEKASLVKGADDRGMGILLSVKSGYFKDKYICATVRPNILPQLTDNESGNGKITNVGEIKSITIEGYSLDYEAEIILELERSDGTIIGMSPKSIQKNGGGAFSVTWENPAYIDDVTKRDIAFKPIYPNVSSELILRGIKVRGIPDYTAGKTTGYVIIYINKITVVADKAYENEDPFNESIWGLEAAANTDYGKRQEDAIEKREKLRAKEKALMVTSDEK